jgi:hypothetical protein
MRKITKFASTAFLLNRTFKRGNTEVVVSKIVGDGIDLTSSALLLHNNLIATLTFKDGKAIEMFITNAGWSSNTTKERLNGLPGVNIYQKNWQWYLNGEQWDGKLTKINF